MIHVHCCTLLQILSAALLLRFGLGLDAEAAAVEAAVDSVLASGLRTGDLRGQRGAPEPGTTPVDCTGMGSAVAAAVLRASVSSSSSLSAAVPLP